MDTTLKMCAELNDKNIELRRENESLKTGLEKSRIEGILLGLKICKEMFAQGTISHENIYENEILYREELDNLKH